MSETKREFFESTTTDYQRIFNPERLLIVGISGQGKGVACDLFYALKDFGYKGEILFVNPKGGNFAGRTIYREIEEIPGEIDLATIFVNAAAVPGLLESCRLKGAAGAVIFSSGFGELGTDEGIALEQELVRIIKKGIRVIGPNCMGIYCPEGGLTTLQGPDFPRQSGPVAFIAQSGGQSIDFANAGKSIGLTYSKIVSIGNGIDLRETELLQYFGRDDETRVVNMYIEGIADGDSFTETIREVSVKKPVIVLKGGLSEAGSRAVLSHTASMGGSRTIWESVLRQVNAVQVKDLSEMARTSLAFAYLPAATYKNLSVIGGGGGMGVSAADLAEDFGLNVPPFSSEVAGRIDDILPKPGSNPGNPVDLAIPFAPPQMIKDVLSSAAGDECIDLQIQFNMFSYYLHIARESGNPIKAVVPYEEIADCVRAVIDETGKPVVSVLANHVRGLDHLDVIEMVEAARRAFVERDIATFDSLADAMQAIKHINSYYGGKENEN